jgi:hypothetical protein
MKKRGGLNTKRVVMVVNLMLMYTATKGLESLPSGLVRVRLMRRQHGSQEYTPQCQQALIQSAISSNKRVSKRWQPFIELKGKRCHATAMAAVGSNRYLRCITDAV